MGLLYEQEKLCLFRFLTTFCFFGGGFSVLYTDSGKCMAEARSQTGRRWLWAGIAVILIVVFFTARYFLREKLAVHVAQVEHAPLLNTVSPNGRVEPIVPYRFYSPIATTVKAVYAQDGDTAPAGKLLISLNDAQALAQVANAESGVKSAEAGLYAVTHNGTMAERQAAAATMDQDRLARDQAKQNLDALTKLAATGAASQGEVLSARSQLQTSEATLSAAEQSAKQRFSPDEIARAQAALADAQAALAAAKHVEAQTSIHAPIKGTIYTMDASPSEYTEPGKLLLQMANLSEERVRAYVDEPDLGRLAVGQKAVIRWDAKPDREWKGHITRLPSAVVTYTTRNVGEVLIALDDRPDGLLPDTNVTVQVTISSEANALTMPREALHEQNGKYFAFKVVDGELKRVPITIGIPNITQVPIVSGLNDGDMVATGTVTGEPLQEGIPIKEVR
jgi:HlyD family secretion protein